MDVYFQLYTHTHTHPSHPSPGLYLHWQSRNLGPTGRDLPPNQPAGFPPLPKKSPVSLSLFDDVRFRGFWPLAQMKGTGTVDIGFWTGTYLFSWGSQEPVRVGVFRWKI